MPGHSKKQYLILLPCCLLAVLIFLSIIVVVSLVAVYARKKFGEPPALQRTGIGSALENTKVILSFGTRVPGEDGWNKTREFIETSLENYGFQVSEDSYVYNNVPNMPNPVKFINVIGTRRLNLDNTKSPRTKFVLACHYDSKKFTDFKFLGAIDSVVPCSMILNFAKSINENIADFTSAPSLPFDDLVVVFFDGEEAFSSWSETDSRYGSRGLAQKWKDENTLKDIQYFMLLDLIGAAKPTFYNYDTHFKSTSYSMFSRIVNLETELRGKGLLTTKDRMFFDSQAGGPDDDHAPFMEKGVPIIHWIPTPFPAQWHNESDDFEHLDWDTINDLQTIFQWFMFRYISNHMNSK